jgi:hypothetical protein
MMISSLLLATACMGQVCGPPVVVQSAPQRIVIAPPLYIDYHLGGMSERTREYRNVPYRDGKVRRVPVINGYVPRVVHTRWTNGAERVVYDYTIWEKYETAMAKWRKEREAELKKPEPKLIPSPDPKTQKQKSPNPNLRSILVNPEDKTLVPKPEPEEPKELKLTPPLNLVPVEPKQPDPPKIELSEPPPPQPEPKYLMPVPPSKEEPRVVIPPTYKED